MQTEQPVLPRWYIATLQVVEQRPRGEGVRAISTDARAEMHIVIDDGGVIFVVVVVVVVVREVRFLWSVGVSFPASQLQLQPASASALRRSAVAGYLCIPKVRAHVIGLMAQLQGYDLVHGCAHRLKRWWMVIEERKLIFRHSIISVAGLWAIPWPTLARQVTRPCHSTAQTPVFCAQRKILAWMLQVERRLHACAYLCAYV